MSGRYVEIGDGFAWVEDPPTAFEKLTSGSDWANKDAAQKIAAFNLAGITPEELSAPGTGVSADDLAWMQSQGYTGAAPGMTANIGGVDVNTPSSIRYDMATDPTYLNMLAYSGETGQTPQELQSLLGPVSRDLGNGMTAQYSPITGELTGFADANKTGGSYDAQGNFHPFQNEGWSLGNFISGGLSGIEDLVTSDMVKTMAPMVISGGLGGGAGLGKLLGVSPMVGGAIAGGGTAALTGGDVLKGAVMGGLTSAGSAPIGNTGVSLGQINAGVNVANNLENGNLLGALTGAVNLAGAGNTQVGNTGFTLGDLAKNANLAKSIASGNPRALFTALTSLPQYSGGPSSSDMIEGYFTPGGEGYVAPDNEIINTNPFLADTSDYSNEGRNYLSSDLTQGPGGSPLNSSMFETYSPLTQFATGNTVDTNPAFTSSEAAMDDNSYNEFLTSIGIDPGSVSDFSNADSPSNADILQGINYFDDANAADNIDVGGGWNPVTGTGDAATAEAASQTGVTSSSTLPFGGLTDADVAKLIGGFGGSAGAAGAGALDKIKSLLGNKSIANNLLSLTGLVGGLSAFKDLLSSGGSPAAVPTPAALPRDERALPQWDWNAINAQAAQQGLQPGQFIARNMPQAMTGAYNQPSAQAAATGFAQGGGVLSALAKGGGSGRDDTIHAKLSDGEYVMDAETVALLGDGSTTSGARRLDQMRAKIREHKGKSMATGRFSSNAKSPLTYLKEVS